MEGDMFSLIPLENSETHSELTDDERVEYLLELLEEHLETPQLRIIPAIES
ncbi:unnamed protein product [marine sediment metagenome]|uniref:Uncharacterized protein n=1 Tax=marine sediment metagenome TaxID=412755 RepID=X0VSN6_9ZZZZ